MGRVWKYALPVICSVAIGCGGLTAGKREASKPVVAALQDAGKNRDNPLIRNLALDRANAAIAQEERAGDPSNGSDIKLANDIRSCRDSLLAYGMATESDVKAEMARESDDWLADTCRNS